MKRSRTRVAAALALTIVLGLASRSQDSQLPQFVMDHAGDALWTVAVYLGLCSLLPSGRPVALGGLAFLVSLLVEVSQLLRVDWLDALRATRSGGLVLGSGFLWIDLARYLAGATAIVGLEILWARVVRGLRTQDADD